MPVLLTLMLLSQAPAASSPPENRIAHLGPVAPSWGPDAEDEEDQSIRGVRIPLELLGGAASGVMLGGAATLVYCGLARCDGWDALAGAAVFVLAAPLGVSAGTTIVGNVMDGDGSYWASSLGVLGGCAGSLLILETAHGSTPMGVLAVALPLVGGVAGYEWTSVAHRSALKHVTLAPVASPGPHAMAGLALAGRF